VKSVDFAFKTYFKRTNEMKNESPFVYQFVVAFSEEVLRGPGVSLLSMHSAVFVIVARPSRMCAAALRVAFAMRSHWSEQPVCEQQLQFVVCKSSNAQKQRCASPLPVLPLS